ncbi:MAG: VIT domain-containing protein [Desulfobacter sp.]
MSSETCAELKGSGNIQPVFEGVQVQAELHESLAITTITQSYRNAGMKNIEAVYTFPLPLDAVLLDMTITLGASTRKGTVLPKREAEEQYEEAITDGDAPVMLQNPQPGTYTMNVGNLLPGEHARITIRYGMFLRWQGDTLRYHLPTTIAPRYGSTERAGLEDYQKPETALLTDNLFAFELKANGLLAGMTIESPSHSIQVERSADGSMSRVVLTAKSAFMDRDLIITARKQDILAASAILAQDGDEWLVWGSFQPRFDQTEDATPRSIKIVVDCSGSMAGDSITQAREALLRVLDELRPQDWFNIIAFGSTATPLFNTQVRVTTESLAFARGYLRKLDADMGGTEIGNAINMAIGLRCQEQVPQDVLLVTDGEVWEWEQVVTGAQNAQHRFFTVGVGSAVSEAFVRTLAERTGGACELVSPNEEMAERIHRHFKRIASPCSGTNQVVWPIQPIKTFPEVVPAIFDGDTCNLFAWFAEPPSGDVRLRLSVPNSTEQVLTANTVQSIGGEHSEIARMAAAVLLREIVNEQEGQELAMKYQLVSKWTNYLAIIERNQDAKSDTLPELHKVQQMLAAGWGGAGSVPHSTSARASASVLSFGFCSKSIDIPTFIRDRQRPAANRHVSCSVDSFDYLIMEPAVDNQHDTVPSAWIWDCDEQLEVSRFVELLDTTLSAGIMPTTMTLPLLPQGILDLIHKMIEDGVSEKIVVTVFLYCLAASGAGRGLSRHSKRLIEKTYKQLQVDQQIAMTLEGLFRTSVAEASYEVPTYLRKGRHTAIVP